MTFKMLSTAVAALMIGQAATAQEVGEISVGIGSTSMGLSLEAQYGVAPNIAVRGMLMGGFNIEDEFEIEDETVDGKAEFGGVAVVADYYPFANPWRISGGLMFSSFEISGENESSESFEIGFARDVIPMVTTGFDYEFTPGWSVTGDIGVLISSLEASSDDADPADVEDLNNDLEDIPVFPFVGLAVTYTY